MVFLDSGHDLQIAGLEWQISLIESMDRWILCTDTESVLSECISKHPFLLSGSEELWSLSVILNYFSFLRCASRKLFWCHNQSSRNTQLQLAITIDGMPYSFVRETLLICTFFDIWGCPQTVCWDKHPKKVPVWDKSWGNPLQVLGCRSKLLILAKKASFNPCTHMWVCSN